MACVVDVSLLCHSSPVLPPGPTEVQTSCSLNILPVFPAQMYFWLCYGRLPVLICHSASFWDCNLLNSGAMPQADIVGKYKVTAPSSPRKSLAELGGSAAHFLLAFCSLGVAVNTPSRTDQIAADTEKCTCLADTACRGTEILTTIETETPVGSKSKGRRCQTGALLHFVTEGLLEGLSAHLSLQRRRRWRALLLAVELQRGEMPKDHTRRNVCWPPAAPMGGQMALRHGRDACQASLIPVLAPFP